MCPSVTRCLFSLFNDCICYKIKDVDMGSCFQFYTCLLIWVMQLELKLIYKANLIWVLPVTFHSSVPTSERCMLKHGHLVEVEMFDGLFTHSSLVRSCVSLTRSLKHPREYMLSNTSGSSSVRERILFKHTRRGGGCSGQGSLRPLLIGKSQFMQFVYATTNINNDSKHLHEIKHQTRLHGVVWIVL